MSWAEDWPERIWVVENVNGLGRLLSQQLVRAGEQAVDGDRPSFVDIYRGPSDHAKDAATPKHYPPEFKRDVVAPSSGLAQDEIARDFGISTPR